MKTVCWWHCFAGIAGDMALGSLVDAGADIDLIERELVGLRVGGWSLETERVLRGGIAATRAVVIAKDSTVVRTYPHITGLLTEARLADRVRTRALNIFSRLAEVEGALHRRPAEQVHFHEVGAADAIIDIVGTSVALEILGVDEVCASPVAQGTGLIKSVHGVIPNPAPAVVRLLEGAPSYGTDIRAELTTPTGAAILASLVSQWGPMPSMNVRSSGFGAGSREHESLPNVVHAVIGSADENARAGAGQPIDVLETNVDDVTGEVLAHVVARIIAAGAYDAWITPVLGKKGRPAQVLSAIVEPSKAREVRQLMTSETGSLGVRSVRFHRWPASRRMEQVTVAGHPVGVKVSGGRIKAEFEDAVDVALLTGMPVREVIRAAEEEAFKVHDTSRHASARDQSPDGRTDGTDAPAG